MYVSAITVTNISHSFTYKMVAEIDWQRWNKMTSMSPYVLEAGDWRIMCQLSNFVANLC